MTRNVASESALFDGCNDPLCPAVYAGIHRCLAHGTCATSAVRQKRQHFRQAKIDAEKSSPHHHWRSIDALFGHGRVPPLSTPSAKNSSTHGRQRTSDIGGVLPFPSSPSLLPPSPFPSPSPPFPSAFPSPPFPYLSSPSPRSRISKIQLGGLGQKSNLVHFSLKI